MKTRATIVLGRHPAADAGRVLAALDVPEGHHREEHHAPGEGDRDPELLLLACGAPPDALRRDDAGMEFHGWPSLGELSGGQAENLPEPPSGVEEKHHDESGGEQQKRSIEQTLTERDRLGGVARFVHGSLLRGRRSLCVGGNLGEKQKPLHDGRHTAVEGEFGGRGRAADSATAGKLLPAAAAAQGVDLRDVVAAVPGVHGDVLRERDRARQVRMEEGAREHLRRKRAQEDASSARAAASSSASESVESALLPSGSSAQSASL